MTQAQSTRTPAIDATVFGLFQSRAMEAGDFSGADAGGVTLKFSNGEELTLTTQSLSNEILWQAAAHGLKQKLVDAAAISRNTDTGQSATVADKFEAVKEVYDRLLAGEWNKRRGDGEGSGSLLLRALLVMKPEKTREQLETYLSGLTKAQQAALRANPKVAAVIETLRVKPAAGVDTDAMLDAI